MDRRNVVDVSSFLLFEATGDSEADSDLNMGSVSVDMDVADDDAQSCSCDLSDCPWVTEFDNLDDDDEADANDVDDLGFVHHDEDYDDDDDEEDQEEVVNQNWAGDYRVAVAPPSEVTASQRKKSRPCIDPTKEFMNEMERNRLFWDTCLAS